MLVRVNGKMLLTMQGLNANYLARVARENEEVWESGPKVEKVWESVPKLEKVGESMRICFKCYC